MTGSDTAFSGWGSRRHAGAGRVLPPHLADNAAFIAAFRHSRRVRFLRKAIPVGAAMAIAFLVLRGFLGFLIGLDPNVEGFKLDGSKVVMEKPRLSGFKRDGRSYELTADTAKQDIKTPNVVELDKLNARMQTGNDGWANLIGARGVYDSKGERLDVDGGLNVRTETGLDAKLRDARIEFKAGTIITDKPVEVTMPQGAVGAERMEVIDNGRRLVFEGRVRSVFVNTNGKEPAQAAGGTGDETPKD